MKSWERRGAVLGVHATRLTKRSRRVSCVAVKDSTISCMRARSGRKKRLNFRTQVVIDCLGRRIQAAWVTLVEWWARAWVWAVWLWTNRSSHRQSRLVWPREQELVPLSTVISKEIPSVWSAFFLKTARIPSSTISQTTTLIRCHRNLLPAMIGEKSWWSSASTIVKKSLTFRETSNSRSVPAVQPSRWRKTLLTRRRIVLSTEGSKGRDRETCTRLKRSSTWRMKLQLRTPIHSRIVGHRRQPIWRKSTGHWIATTITLRCSWLTSSLTNQSPLPRLNRIRNCSSLRPST